MSINSTHPLYDAHVAEWLLLRRAFMGEAEIKRHGVTYLPPTKGQIIDGMGPGNGVTVPIGQQNYDSYKARARFPGYVREAVENFVGMLHCKAATIELPAAMEELRTKATVEGESLDALLRRINAEQLITGRIGLLVDLPAEVPSQVDTLPYVATYTAESIINWDESADHKGVNALNLVVLNESGFERISGFEWKEVERYRALMLDMSGAAPLYVQDQYTVDSDSSEVEPNPADMLAPTYKGRTLEQIPFILINALNVVVSPDVPPLQPLAEDCLGVYRGEADYRQSLHNQAQDTLVIANSGQRLSDTPGGVRIGAGALIELEKDGKAEFIGTNSEGIPEQRSALENDRKAAETRAGSLVNPGANNQESGEALTTRLAAQTASLVEIAKTGALGLQNALRLIATWMGQDPEAVVVTPNLEFKPLLLTGQEIVQLVSARTMGAPLSMESIHGVMRDRGLTKFDYATEVEMIAEEDMVRATHIATLPQPPAPPAPEPAKTPGEDE